MAIIVHVKPAAMSATLYNETITRLEAAGAGRFPGRTHHFCYGTDDRRMVTDIFDSMESFQAFGQILIPILKELGIDPNEPEIHEIQNTIIL